MVITKTWKNAAATEFSTQLPSERHAGGLSVYKLDDFAYTNISVQIELTVSLQVT